MTAPVIQPLTTVMPKLYAFSVPEVPNYNGYLKIGYTDRQTVAERVLQQRKTLQLNLKLEWQDFAFYKVGKLEVFRDTAFHKWMEVNKNVQRHPDKPTAELFKIDVPTLEKYFTEFTTRKIPFNESKETYQLRKEQQDAVKKTKAYFEAGGDEFLWNAKPRFGKTLTAYELVQQMQFDKVLVVTNRPSIANAWAEDFYKFLSWKREYAFVSDNAGLRKKTKHNSDINEQGKQVVISRKEFLNSMSVPENPKKMIAFESLQGLKGSIYFGEGNVDKLKWMSNVTDDGLAFDLLIVDESHEGIDTLKTEIAFEKITRKHTLYLSGTPFKQIANSDFNENQIFNWSYTDEQGAKENWQGEDYNPYQRLPKLNLFTYQLGEMITQKAQRGIDLGEDLGAVDYAFDLNEFFSTHSSGGNKGKFIHEEDVKKFINALKTQEKYPFSTPKLRNELAHTLWYLNRIDSVYALAELLRKDEVFKEYEIVEAVGDAKNENMPNLTALEQVKKTVEEKPKSITLTVGQLTVGITVPQWTAVLMLCNLSSPAMYMQAAFRAQNPWQTACLVKDDDASKHADLQFCEKENAYIFDFDPARTLIIYDEYANNLYGSTAGGGGTPEERKENLKRLLNFLPVLGEDTEGRMVELNAEQVLSIPRKLKSQEVVNRGFMSNFLFSNIAGIFKAPGAVKEILEKMPKAAEEKRKQNKHALDNIGNVNVNEQGKVEIPENIVIGEAQRIFGPKRYEKILKEDLKTAEEVLKDDTRSIRERISTLTETFVERNKEEIIKPIREDKGVSKTALQKAEKQIEAETRKEMNKLETNYIQKHNIAVAEHKEKSKAVTTEAEKAALEKEYNKKMDDALKDLIQEINNKRGATLEETSKIVIRQIEEAKSNQEKQEIENAVREHLRGFSRTIPSFLMAYGDDNINLANFETYVSPEIFEDVASITPEEFRFLRDGGNYTDDNGETQHFSGHLFDETVFNDSVKVFLNKKRELANYFDEKHSEDIFDYIPPQKTNQIFTPRWVVQLMADKLEEENPGCFDNPNHTFADLYMKSGLYITEIVKRLYNSKGLKKAFPNENERIAHILEKQVYGIAPTDIIYKIAINYILGFDDELKKMSHNFILADTVAACKNGTLQALIDENFDKKTRKK